jgi:peptide/nickel transport system substrate-binding protein
MPGRVGPGSRIAGYLIEAQIGAGGMAVVYRARDEALGRLAAVKVLSPALAADEEFRSRFVRESRMVAVVDDPHVIPVYAAGEADGVLYIATRFIPDGDLAGVIRRDGAFAPERAAAIITQVASALDAAHEAGLVHRDVKPGNVLIDTTRASTEHAYLSDFGLTRGDAFTAGLTLTGDFLGTPGYCAPEQIRGEKVDGRTDQYALACVAFVMLTGAPAFHRQDAVATLFAHLSGPAPSATALRPELPSLVDAVLARALAMDPQERFTSCGEFATALGQVLAPPEPVSPQPGAPVPPPGGPLPPRDSTLPPGGPSPDTAPPAPGPADDRTVTVLKDFGQGSARTGSRPGQPRPRRKAALVAGAAAAVLVAAGAGAVLALPGSSGSSAGAGPGSGPAFNAGLTNIVNPSSRKGGTLALGVDSVPDSLDPGNTYYGWTWDFSRLYATPLTTFKSAPGPAGNTLVPGIATSLGQVSDNGLTWTYHIKQGLKFSDGSPVTAAAVKYAVERTYDRSVLGNGPTYFQSLLADSGYPGPYKAPNADLTSVTTPDPYTIQFHLTVPFQDFDYVAAIPQTAPVPQANDTGATYQENPVSTGPYMFQSHTAGKSAVLVPNPYFTPEEDTEARQLLSKITLTMGSSDVDTPLLAGRLDLDAGDTGLQATARSQVMSSNSRRANTDNPLANILWYVSLNTKVAPLDNLACRQAIEYAADKSAFQAAFGGPVAGGDIASTLMLPGMGGYKGFDLYNAKSQPAGDIASARQALSRCGHPNGFTVTAAYRTDSARATASATTLQAALSRVGITLQLKAFPSITSYLGAIGQPGYLRSHGIGVTFAGWQPDWPDGYGMMSSLVNGNAIAAAGNPNLSELNDPVINNLFTQAGSPLLGAAERSMVYGQIDQQAMKDAAILPLVYARVLRYRSPRVTNAYIESSYGMYNYAVLGVTS